MERTITTEDLITLEALRMHRNMMAYTMNSAEIGIFTILKIDPKNDEDLDKVVRFMETDMDVVELVGQLGIGGVVSGKKESQRKQEGQASGEGVVEGTEPDTSDLD